MYELVADNFQCFEHKVQFTYANIIQLRISGHMDVRVNTDHIYELIAHIYADWYMHVYML